MATHRCVRDVNCTFFTDEGELIGIYRRKVYCTHNVRHANYIPDIIIVRRLATLHLNDRASNCLARHATLFDPGSSVVNSGFHLLVTRLLQGVRMHAIGIVRIGRSVCSPTRQDKMVDKGWRSIRY